jgi:hypothetical protein
MLYKDPTLTRKKYIDRNGEAISLEQWRNLRMNKGYTHIKEFENDTLYAAVIWKGEVDDSNTVPPEHWKPYTLIVQNIVATDAEGQPHPEPKRVRDPELSGDFRSEREALEAYEDALVRYAQCEWLPSSYKPGEHHFVERGNKLAPPPPDEPRVKAGEFEIDPSVVGSW